MFSTFFLLQLFFEILFNIIFSSILHLKYCDLFNTAFKCILEIFRLFFKKAIIEAFLFH